MTQLGINEPHLICVDEHGRSPDGDDFDQVAAPAAVAAGLVINVPVLLLYPDGRQRRATQVRLTPKGVEEISRGMGLSAGRRQ